MRHEATEALVLQFLAESAGITFWIDGGWGVDALLGEQTRAHSDLDIIIAREEQVALLSQLNDFSPAAARGDNVFQSPQGLWLDIHVVEFGEDGAGNFDLPDGGVWPLPASAFEGVGHIGGVEVGCLSPEAQVLCHAQGYEPTEKDRQDMDALKRRFDLVIPPSLEIPGDG